MVCMAQCKTPHIPKHKLPIQHDTGMFTVLQTINFCTCSHRVQEEEELPHSSADVEGVEGFLQALELGQSGDQLQDVVLKVLQ